MDLTTLDSSAPADPRRDRLRARQVVALIAIVLGALLSLWGTPRDASEAAFGAALRAGQVTSWDLQESGQRRYGLEIDLGVTVTFGTSTAPQSTVVWSDTAGRLYRTRVDTLQSLEDPNAPEGSNLSNPSADVIWSDGYQVDVGESIAATARAAGVAVPSQGIGAAGYLGWPLVALGLVALLVLLASAQPRRRTKWGTFWMLGVTAGVGLAWWVITDSPWSARTDALPEPAPRQRGPVPGVADRRGGGVMLLVSIVASLGVALVLYGLRVVPGLGARPAPPPGSVTWSVVWSTGSTGSLNE